MYTSRKALDTALCLTSSATVKTFYEHLILLSKVITSHSTLLRLLWTFHEGCFFSLACCTFAPACYHMSNLSVSLFPLKLTYFKNLGIYCCMAESSYLTSCHLQPICLHCSLLVLSQGMSIFNAIFSLLGSVIWS